MSQHASDYTASYPTEIDTVLAEIGVTRCGWKPDDNSISGDERFCASLPEGSPPKSLDAWLGQVHAGDRTRVNDKLQSVAEYGKPIELSCRISNREGEQRWSKLSAARSADKAWVHVCWFDTHDQVITRRRLEERESQLLQRQRMETVDCLAGGVAHEFNNVLQIVRGYVSFARDALPEDSETREDLVQALIATDRAAGLASQLLGFVRSKETDELVTDINDTVGGVGMLLKPIIGEHINLSVACSAERLPTLSPDGHLKQALLNLCVNARDAMPQGGDLLMRVERFDTESRRPEIGAGLNPGCYARIWVSDTGSGIPVDMQEKIFEPFYTTKEKKGTGLGLAVVKSLTEQAGGALTLTSRPGSGTCFAVYVPLDEESLMLRQPEEAVADLFDRPEVLAARGGDNEWPSAAQLLEALAEYGAPAECAAALEGLTIVDESADQHAYELALEAKRDGRPVLVATQFDPESSTLSKWRRVSDAQVALPANQETLYTALHRVAAPHAVPKEEEMLAS